jgi:hypothetical protein
MGKGQKEDGEEQNLKGTEEGWESNRKRMKIDSRRMGKKQQ